MQPFSNPIFSGGLGLMLLGSAIALLRNVPDRLWHLSTRWLWLECRVDGWDPAFFWLNQWLASRPEIQDSGLIRVESRFYDSNTGGTSERKSVLVPGVGEHVVKYEGARFLIILNKEERPFASKQGLPGPGTDNIPYTITFRCRRKHRKLLINILNCADTLSAQPDPERTRIWIGSSDYWRLTANRQLRRPESVILAQGVWEYLCAQVTRFDTSKAWYESLGIPYRYGCLLHGKPGNGKSSVVLALAGALGRDLYLLSLADPYMNDTQLLTLMSSIPTRSVVLIEDIDTVFEGRTKQSDNKLTLTGLLNALDGAATNEGRILFITANFPEVLDAALTRPGRCDDHVELSNATPDQADRLFLRFFPEAKLEFAYSFAAWAGSGAFSMATLQGHLLRNHTDPSKAALSPD